MSQGGLIHGQEAVAQLEFLWRDQENLERELEQRTGERIDITLTDNSSSMMTYRSSRGGQPAELRLHRMFLSANPKVVGALGRWLTRRRSRRSATLLDDFIKQNEHLIRERKSRGTRLATLGDYHDLGELYDEVNRSEFDGKVAAPITWGRRPTRRRRRSIRLGSYTPEDGLIRIHPYLDQRFVPRYFIRYIVFHEMLHAYLGVEEGPSGRRRVHTSEFKRMERAYADYGRAVAWHDDPKKLAKLLRA